MKTRLILLVLLGILLGVGLAPRDRSWWTAPGSYTEHHSGLGPDPRDGPGPGQVRWESFLLSFYLDLDFGNWWLSVPGCCEEPSLAGWRSLEIWQMEDRGFTVLLTRPTPCSRPEFCTVTIRSWVIGYDSGLEAPYGPWLGWPNPYWRDP